jgi:lipid-A-disaccharide synthase
MSRSPRGVVVIDSPDFHIPLVRTLRKKGYQGRVFYIAPPTVWAWRQGRVKALAEYCDICLPLFDFERAFLEGHGVPCRWYGHPLSGATRETVPADLGQRDGRKVVAMLPGSRSGEVRRLLPQMLIASEGIDRRGFRPVFSVAPGLDPETASFLRGNCEPWETYEGRGTELMAASEMVIGASGTAAVEALILEKFMIVLYKASFSSWLVYKAFVRSPLISIPNILAGGVIYPELLQSDVSAGKILGHFDLYMGSSQQRRTVDESIRATASVLNGGDAPAGWGAAIMEAISS